MMDPALPSLAKTLTLIDTCIQDAQERLIRVETSNGASVLLKLVADLSERKLRLVYDYEKILDEREARMKKMKSS